ncbi:Acetamidase [Termitomyces sp. J132]|nr:Acetamidase [Termitomyces sp. J132]
MVAYAKKTVAAHAATNCVTDLMFDEALRIPAVANWPHNTDLDAFDSTRDRSLLGVPVSIKDTIDIAGHDTTIGYSRNTNHPMASSSAVVRLLQDAGALVHVKTTVPTGLLGLETGSEVYGRTSNPYKSTHTTGASTGGGAALIACGGSKIEIGTDVAGSVRLPAHFCGIWSLKGSAGRFPTWGNQSSMEGLEGLQLVSSPMAGSLEDLDEFWKRVITAKPWEYDHTVGPVPITPACKRGLSMVATALRKQGHEVVEFIPPDLERGLNIAYQLLFSDGGEQLRSLLSPGEGLNKVASSVLGLLALPKCFKQFLAYFTQKSDPASASLLRIMHTKSVTELRALTAQRESYRAEWHDSWREKGLDFIITVPHPFPAFKHGESEKVNLMTAGFTTIFSLLDYTAGVLPVTFVDKDLDCLPVDFKAPSLVASVAYSAYDADGMHGLPLGVQIVGKRLEEERVLEGMKIVQDALKQQGIVFASQAEVAMKNDL